MDDNTRLVLIAVLVPSAATVVAALIAACRRSPGDRRDRLWRIRRRRARRVDPPP